MNDDVDPIVDRNRCPACGAEPGARCRTVMDGTDAGWTHDARVYADLARGLDGGRA